MMYVTGPRQGCLIAGKWSVSPLTPQYLIDQEKENEREGKAVCSIVRDESIDGVSATLADRLERIRALPSAQGYYGVGASRD